MVILLNLLLLLIAGITIVLAHKRGFVKTFISAVSTLVALIMVFCFTTPLANFLSETSIAESVREATQEELTHMLEGVSPDAGATGGVSETLLETLHIDSAEFRAWVRAHAHESAVKFHETVSAYLTNFVSDLILRALAALLLFAGTTLLLFVVGNLLSGVVEHLPFISGANHLLGLVLGIVQALIRVCLFATVVCALIDASAVADLPLLGGTQTDSLFLLRLFDLRNLLPRLL